MFENGIAEIVVGANTKTERRELKMRYDDALCAVSSLNEGVVLSGCITYYKISELLSNSIGEIILKNALTKPLEQLIENSSIDKSIIDDIKLSNYKKIYNIKKEQYENVLNTSVIDPACVLKVALQNACSIASMLLTTNSLVINEMKNELNKN